ncbi:MAG: mechanosensitive ion channel family protein [Chloroflexi bacterium]|nr:mechanosensitive ion channel family protein [Chloroflexota bacterium]
MIAPDFLIDLLGERDADNSLRLFVAVLILLVTLLSVRLVLRLLLKLIHRVTSRTTMTLDEEIIDALVPPIRFLATIIGLWVALLVLNLSDQVTDIVDQFGASLVAVAIFWALYRLVDVVALYIVNFSKQDQRVDTSLVRFGQEIIKAVVIIIAFIVIMEQFGYNLNGLMAGLGITGLAVALAAQEALSNLIGYFVIMADSPFDIGDFIETDAATGTVEDVGFRSTAIRKLDQGLVSVPNAILIGNSITNWSRLTKRRLDMYLGISYDTPPTQILAVVQALRDMLNDHERVIADTVFVQFIQFGESSLDIRLICNIDRADWTAFQQVKEDVFIQIMNILSKHNVEIAFPTRTIIMQPDGGRDQQENYLYSQPLPEAAPLPGDADMKLPQPDTPDGTEEMDSGDGEE